jgi:hypothetical protein
MEPSSRDHDDSRRRRRWRPDARSTTVTLALSTMLATGGLTLALSPAAAATVAIPLVSSSTSESAGSQIGRRTVLSVTFNETPVLASSYSLTLTDGSGVGTLSSALGNLSASVDGDSIDFTVHRGPSMSAGSSLSRSVLEILASSGVSDASGNPWDLVASGQIDTPDRSGTCLDVAGYTRVFGGSNCDIGVGHPGPPTPDVYDVIPLPTTAHQPRGLPHAAPTGAQQRDLLTLSKRQIPPRQRGLGDRRHPATLTKPTDADRRRYTASDARLLARQTARDRRPEPLAILTPRHRWSTRRAHRRPPRTIRSTPPRCSHHNSSRSSVATTT